MDSLLEYNITNSKLNANKHHKHEKNYNRLSNRRIAHNIILRNYKHTILCKKKKNIGGGKLNA